MGIPLDPLDHDLAEEYSKHMEACYLAGRADGRKSGFNLGLVVGAVLIVLLLLAWAFL